MNSEGTLCRLFVVIPIYNEEKYLPQTLNSLTCQSDMDFALVLVDNGSTDASLEMMNAFGSTHSQMQVHCVKEATQSSGAASDTGFRFAIEHGATHIARTDADSLVDVEWVRNIKRAFVHEGLEFVGGAIQPRADEDPKLRERLLVTFFVAAADVVGRIRWRGRQYYYPYFLVGGFNLAITADLYMRVGGFPHHLVGLRSLDDRTLAENVRKTTSRARRMDDVIVYTSLRRFRLYGFWRTLMWYLNIYRAPSTVYVR